MLPAIPFLGVSRENEQMYLYATAVRDFYRQYSYTDVPGAEHERGHPPITCRRSRRPRCSAFIKWSMEASRKAGLHMRVSGSSEIRYSIR